MRARARAWRDLQRRADTRCARIGPGGNSCHQREAADRCHKRGAEATRGLASFRTRISCKFAWYSVPGRVRCAAAGSTHGRWCCVGKRCQRRPLVDARAALAADMLRKLMSGTGNAGLHKVGTQQTPQEHKPCTNRHGIHCGRFGTTVYTQLALTLSCKHVYCMQTCPHSRDGSAGACGCRGGRWSSSLAFARFRAMAKRSQSLCCTPHPHSAPRCTCYVCVCFREAATLAPSTEPFDLPARQQPGGTVYPRPRSRFDAVVSMVVILDGGMGHGLKSSEGIDKMGLPYSQQFIATTLASLHCPEAVVDMHKRFIEAGCGVLTTNSFCATSYHFARGQVDEDFAAVAEARTCAADCRRAVEVLLACSPRVRHRFSDPCRIRWHAALLVARTSSHAVAMLHAS